MEEVVVVVGNGKGSSQEVSGDKDDSKEKWKGAEMMGKRHGSLIDTNRITAMSWVFSAGWR